MRAGPWRKLGAVCLGTCALLPVLQAPVDGRVADALQHRVVETVRPMSSDSSAVRFASYNLFVTLHGAEIEVATLVEVENSGSATSAGRGEGETRRVTPFVLPADAYAVRSHAGRLVPGRDDTVYDSQVLAPGVTRIAFTFRLDARGRADTYMQRISLPARQMDVFLAPSTVSLGEGFDDLGVAELGGVRYHHGRRIELPAGERVPIPLPVLRDWAAVLRWGALGTAVLAVVAVVAISSGARRGGDVAGVRYGDRRAFLISRRRALIEQIAELDTKGDGMDASDRRRRLVEEAVAATHLLDLPDEPR